MSGTAAGFVNGIGSAALFNQPNGVASNGAGLLFESDYGNNVVRAIVVSTAAVSVLAGGGSPNGTAAGFLDATGAAALFNNPIGLSWAPSVLYVADATNNLIRAIALPGGAVTTVAGGGAANGTAAGYADGAGSAAQFNYPYGVAADAAGAILYVGDSNNNVIRAIVLSSAPAVVTTLAGGGGGGGTASGYLNMPAGTSALQALFSRPRGVGVAAGVVFVADQGNNLIRSINVTSGAVATVAGGGSATGTTEFYADGYGTAAGFKLPAGVSVGSAGQLLVADTWSQRIRTINASGFVSTLAGGGSSSGTVSGFANGVGSAALFYSPASVAADGAGFVFVADDGNSLVRAICAPLPTPSTTATPSATPTPSTTATSSATPTPSPSATPSAMSTPSTTATPSATPMPSPFATPSAMPTPSTTATPSATPTPSPSATPFAPPTP